MTTLIPTINEIVKYGLQPNLVVPDRNKELERNLIKIYTLYFDIQYEFDRANYPDFDKTTLPDIRKNIAGNFEDFGYYTTVLDIEDLDSADNTAIGDAIDDLTDITTDLLEVKWRIENNSLANGLWFFEFIFKAHTQQHLLDLLNYMKQKSE